MQRPLGGNLSVSIMIPLFISKNEMTISTRREFLSTPMCLMYPRGLRPTSADEDRGRSIKRWRMITTLRTEVSPVGIGLHQQRQTTARRRLIAAAGHKPRPPVRWIATRHFSTFAPLRRSSASATLSVVARAAPPDRRTRLPSTTCANSPYRGTEWSNITANSSAISASAPSGKRNPGSDSRRSAPRSRPSSTVATGSWSRHTSRSRTDSRQSATIFYIRQSKGRYGEIAGWAFLGGAEM